MVEKEMNKVARTSAGLGWEATLLLCERLINAGGCLHSSHSLILKIQLQEPCICRVGNVNHLRLW